MFEFIFDAIKNAIIWVFNQFVNLASELLNVTPVINFIKKCINYFPPFFSIACIAGLVFLVGIAVKRIFFS